MNCCCNDGGGGHGVRAKAVPQQTRRTWWGRVVSLVQWAAPITALALVPKCPACVAAYVLVFSGVGLSLPAAAAVRWGMIGLCVGALVYLLVRALRRAVKDATT